jgi:hypothetical protein
MKLKLKLTLFNKTRFILKKSVHKVQYRSNDEENLLFETLDKINI